MARVNGKVALVTGAASGIGKAIAEILVREGARVMLTDINVEAGESLAEKLGDNALFAQHDVRMEQDWQRVIAETRKNFDLLDVLVNNAGIASAELIEDTSLERWREIMAINLDGVFLGVKYGIEIMKQSGGGSIINISSVAGLVGTPRTGSYSASKAGVKLLSKCAALECAESGYNIRVNSVHPGIIETPPCREVFKILGEGDEDVGKQFIVGLHPIGRMGHVNDVANGVLYLASDESSFVTGSELVIDGGMTAQ
jgi:3(or 17)beta-hydroxysteroid dehydrogenase